MASSGRGVKRLLGLVAIQFVFRGGHSPAVDTSTLSIPSRTSARAGPHEGVHSVTSVTTTKTTTIILILTLIILIVIIIAAKLHQPPTMGQA